MPDNNTDGVYNLLKTFHNHKYILILDSLLVGLIVGIVIVIYRLLASTLGELFIYIYSIGRDNVLLIPLIFLLFPIFLNLKGYFL